MTGLSKYQWLACSLGSLGGGNHFIEIDQGADGTHYLVIHSGSRNLGKQVAEIYKSIAADEAKGINNYEKERNELVRTLKEQGRFGEIQSALEEFKSRKYAKSEVDEDLCSLSGQNFEDYLHDMKICQDFAVRNRERIAGTLLDLTGLLIPLNMRDGSILAVGKGNPDWNYSAPHGAGRLMSRMQARASLKVADFADAMEGIYTTSVCEGTIDEAPMVYKPMENILKYIGDTVEIIEIIKPIYNFKAEEKKLF